jgi:hypothetical protein
LKGKVLAFLLLAEAVVGLFAGARLYAYFCDVETSSGNVFSAGTWAVYGELIDFIVPENVVQGQTANFTVVFQNCGDVTTYAVANVQIRRGETGENITLIQTPLTPVESDQTMAFQLQWDTTGYNPGNYRAIAWVQYNSHTTNPADPTKFHVTNEKAADINIVEE